MVQVLPLGKRHLFIPYNGKIANITHADTNTHTLNVKTALGETRTIKAMHIGSFRVSGTSTIGVRSSSVSGRLQWLNNSSTFLFIGSDQLLYYSLDVANDVFDLYCDGYVVEV